MTSTPISCSYLRITFSCLSTELIYYGILWCTLGNIERNPTTMSFLESWLFYPIAGFSVIKTASSFPMLKMSKTHNLLRAVKRRLLFCLHKAFKIKMIVCISYTSDSSNMYKIHFYVLSDDYFYAKEIKIWHFLVEKISEVSFPSGLPMKSSLCFWLFSVLQCHIANPMAALCFAIRSTRRKSLALSTAKRKSSWRSHIHLHWSADRFQKIRWGGRE